MVTKKLIWIGMVLLLSSVTFADTLGDLRSATVFYADFKNTDGSTLNDLVNTSRTGTITGADVINIEYLGLTKALHFVGAEEDKVVFDNNIIPTSGDWSISICFNNSAENNILIANIWTDDGLNYQTDSAGLSIDDSIYQSTSAPSNYKHYSCSLLLYNDSTNKYVFKQNSSTAQGTNGTQTYQSDSLELWLSSTPDDADAYFNNDIASFQVFDEYLNDIKVDYINQNPDWTYSDVTPPTLTTLPSNGTTSNIPLDFAWINVSGNENTTITMNDTRWILNISNETHFKFWNPNYNSLPVGQNIINITANDTNQNNATTLYFLTLDTIIPIIASNLEGNDTFVMNNLSFHLNVTDNILIWSINFSLDTTNIFNLTGIDQPSYFHNESSYNTTNLSVGVHNINGEVCDAHTTKEIGNYDISLTQNKITFDNIWIKSLMTTNKINYKKLEDRYTFSFEYEKARTEIEIEIPNDCKYINNPIYKGWFVCGKKWLDFEGDHNVQVNGKIVTITSQTPKTKFTFNSIGSLNCVNFTYLFYKFNISEEYTTEEIENSLSTFNFTIYHPNGSSTSANLKYNNTIYQPTKSNLVDKTIYKVTLTTPLVSGDKNINFYWNYTINNTAFDTTIKSQTISDFQFNAVCNATFHVLILNLTLFDEETKLHLPPINSTIEIEIEFINQNLVVFNYSYIGNGTNNLSICIKNGSYSGYSLHVTASYISDNYEQEFFFLDNGSLSTADILNSHTSRIINLYDLKSSDSTTFFFSFYDENGLSVDDAIVHTFRKYVGDGIFREIERSKEDNNGETHLHLVEEDVIYYFVVSQYGRVVYTSNEYNAKCLTTPCQIELSATDEIISFPTDWTNFSGLYYSISQNKTARTVTLNFAADTNTLVNMSLYEYDNNEIILINSSSITGISESIELYVPRVYGNSTYFVVLHKDNEYINSEWVDFRESGFDYFGADSLIMSVLIIATLSLMAVSEGIVLVIVAILSVLILGLMYLVNLSWAALIGIICMGGIIIWKIIKKR